VQSLKQQIEHLRYQAGLAERQFDRVDPDNRNVAAELERRWEAALRELHQTEEGFAQRQASRARPLEISADVRSAFLATGRRLPVLWQDPALGIEHRKALLCQGAGNFPQYGKAKFLVLLQNSARDKATVTLGHCQAAMSNSELTKAAWATMSLPSMPFTCPFLIIASVS
jgi:hypothetical protein